MQNVRTAGIFVRRRDIHPHSFMVFRNELHKRFSHFTQPDNDDLFTFIHSELPNLLLSLGLDSLENEILQPIFNDGIRITTLTNIRLQESSWRAHRVMKSETQTDSNVAALRRNPYTHLTVIDIRFVENRGSS